MLDMKRREFIGLVGGELLTDKVRRARAQQPERMRRIGVLMSAAAAMEGQARIAAFRRAASDSILMSGRNGALRRAEVQ